MMYDYMLSKEQYRIILDVQEYFETFGEENKIRVLGSYNPADIPCSEAEFFDEMHPRPECIDYIFQ